MDNQPSTVRADDRSKPTVSAVQALQRWEGSGGVWRVVSISAGRVVISMLTCDAGEEMDRLVSSDPEVLSFVGDRNGSDHPTL